MGNCCRSEHRSMVSAGDDWGSLMPKKEEEAENKCDMKKQRLLGDQKGAFGRSPASSTSITSSSSCSTAHVTREVKIKIRKEELEELLGRVDVQGLSAKQVLESWLVHAADRRFNNVLAEHHRPWRPALQSIPEVN
ncbi:hypothetical protein I3760_10G069900 [Carya illinoinensis]|uniref:Uncharacterized protein n=1 Tax=Carya illinoinensis TaxID=32201 RepID=A0A8T1PCU1_CARIL|nr:uncharacterized protein LOC122278251 [Carya illinoinensis]KAG2684289.1 hypothetical protein I3760_10G069900 [Carya illinoinensis]KAG6639002.1 hypothetical protein CIPAW_10G070500 [Carya illinoinensis]